MLLPRNSRIAQASICGSICFSICKDSTYFNKLIIILAVFSVQKAIFYGLGVLFPLLCAECYKNGSGQLHNVSGCSNPRSSINVLILRSICVRKMTITPGGESTRRRPTETVPETWRTHRRPTETVPTFGNSL